MQVNCIKSLVTVSLKLKYCQTQSFAKVVKLFCIFFMLQPQIPWSFIKILFISYVIAFTVKNP